MKKLLIFAVILGLSGLLWFLYSRRSIGSAIAAAGSEQRTPALSAASATTPSAFIQTLGSLTGKYPRWEGARSADLNDPRWAVWRDRQKRDPAWQGKIAIDFYGKVVDFDGQPIADAKILFTLNDLSLSGSSQSATVSDASGLFSLTNAEGKFLDVQINKEGYYTSRLNPNGFEYAQFSDERFYQPDSNNPVVFRLQKKGQAEAIIHRETLYGLKIDGTQQYIDLMTGKKTTGGQPLGDISVSLVRSPPGDTHNFGWTLNLAGIGAAGFVQSSDEFMFTAPDSGYQSSIAIREQVDASDYARRVDRNYYVRLADGTTYARINVDIRPQYNDEGAIDLTLFLNPTGSRNLEYSPIQNSAKTPANP
jgi:hypothetical protein